MRKLRIRWADLTRFGEMVTGDHIIVNPNPDERALYTFRGNHGVIQDGFIPRPDSLADGEAVEVADQRAKKLTRACASVLGHRYALVMLDIYSRFLLARPLKTKTGLAAMNAFKQWRGRR